MWTIPRTVSQRAQQMQTSLCIQKNLQNRQGKQLSLEGAASWGRKIGEDISQTQVCSSCWLGLCIHQEAPHWPRWWLLRLAYAILRPSTAPTVSMCLYSSPHPTSHSTHAKQLYMCSKLANPDPYNEGCVRRHGMALHSTHLTVHHMEAWGYLDIAAGCFFLCVTKVFETRYQVWVGSSDRCKTEGIRSDAFASWHGKSEQTCTVRS
jgi:hypothetical protein